jgi:hypothetical protein
VAIFGDADLQGQNMDVDRVSHGDEEKGKTLQDEFLRRPSPPLYQVVLQSEGENHVEKVARGLPRRFTIPIPGHVSEETTSQGKGT